ncbi:MAG: hypothetical protein WC775_04820 [Patescibacteria group bacterium]|jgi:uncharacterized repeat protein (TIGR01451 family)
MKKLLFAGVTVFLLSVICFLIAASSVSADSGSYGQYGQYGGGTAGSGKVLVDKMVRNPKSGEYVDNIGLNDVKYVADNAVFFKVTVQNVGTSTLSRIDVVDYLPLYVKYVSGGQYDSATRQVKFSFDNVAPNERRSTVLQVRVAPVAELPAEKSVVCPVNKVVASASEGNSDEDTAQFCIERKVMAVSVPQTGDPLGLIFGLGSIPTLLAGLKLRKRA